jgi:hypothetical protein
VLRANWADEGGGGLWMESGLARVDWASVARPLGRFKSEFDFFEFQGFLEFGKTLSNSTRRFRRNLVLMIFP